MKKKKALLDEKERLLREREEAMKQSLTDKEHHINQLIKDKEAELAKTYEQEYVTKLSALEIEMKKHKEELEKKGKGERK